jgi:two-component system, response regulator, stage 0 sporulation protein F
MTITILMVDDEPDAELLFRQKFRREIRRSEIEFYFAQSGEGALTLLQDENAPTVLLVLSDINMPGMSGMELLLKVKKQSPNLPVIMITAYGDEKTEAEAKTKGADQLISKPIDFDRLKTAFTAYREGVQ